MYNNAIEQLGHTVTVMVLTGVVAWCNAKFQIAMSLNEQKLSLKNAKLDLQLLSTKY